MNWGAANVPWGSEFGRKSRLAIRRLLIGGALLAVLLAGASRPAQAGYASLVVDGQTGKVLNEVNADEENHPASLTKMMTLYLAFEALRDGRLHWNDMLPVSRNAANKSPTKLALRPGQRVSVRDCVLGMIVVSANDAATVVGEALAGGSESAFARMMTEKAHELGMSRTVFRNASGLPDPHQVSTARDMARLGMALHHDFPENYPLFATRSFVFEGQERVGHNHLMYRYPGMDGMKTGFTNASGSNLVSSAVHDGRRLFGVVFGGRSAAARDQLMAKLLDNAFDGEPTDASLVAAAAGQPAHPRLARAGRHGRRHAGVVLAVAHHHGHPRGAVRAVAHKAALHRKTAAVHTGHKAAHHAAAARVARKAARHQSVKKTAHVRHHHSDDE